MVNALKGNVCVNQIGTTLTVDLKEVCSALLHELTTSVL